VGIPKRPNRIIVALSDAELKRVDATADRMEESRSRVVRLAIETFCAKAERDATRRSADAYDGR
jgi:metal-responsive CopG/Arc/MetJ family transcriptional regulator